MGFVFVLCLVFFSVVADLFMSFKHIYMIYIYMEKEMATYFSILAWKIPWPEEPGRLQSIGLQRVNTPERLHFHLYVHVCICLLLHAIRCFRPWECNTLEPLLHL